MKRPFFAQGGVKWGLLLLALLGGTRADEGRVARVTASSKHRGVSWVAGPSPVRGPELDALVEVHVDWIAQTPFGWQDRVDSPSLRWITDGRVMWGETDEGLTVTTRLAKERGIHTLLKPHVWLRDRAGGKWVGDIQMANEADWQRWFASYRGFILHYAQLAERLGIEGLVIGTELHTAAATREADWRRLIAEVRQVYSGPLTYAANWYREYEEVRFWDALDWIGIQAYFPLTEQENPSRADLERSWQPHLQAILKVQRQFGKPILFTELGYRSTRGAAIKPWEWPDSRSAATADPDALATQAAAYEAFFRTFWHRDEFAGVYLWKWYPHPPPEGRSRADDFTPQNKPAGRVLSLWFGGSQQTGQ